jgi:hypothetical protein
VKHQQVSKCHSSGACTTPFQLKNTTGKSPPHAWKVLDAAATPSSLPSAPLYLSLTRPELPAALLSIYEGLHIPECPRHRTMGGTRRGSHNATRACQTHALLGFSGAGYTAPPVLRRTFGEGEAGAVAGDPGGGADATSTSHRTCRADAAPSSPSPSASRARLPP